MEVWDLYDNQRNLIGKTCIRGEALAEGENHMVVEVWTINEKHQILVTKRDPKKKFGNLWECTGGAAVAGEDSLTAVRRELREEVGLTAKPEQFLLIGSNFFAEHNCFMDSYICYTTLPISKLKWQEGEVVDGKFVSLEEFEQMQKEGIVAPPVWQRYQMYRELIAREVMK